MVKCISCVSSTQFDQWHAQTMRSTSLFSGYVSNTFSILARTAWPSSDSIFASQSPLTCFAQALSTIILIPTFARAPACLSVVTVAERVLVHCANVSESIW
jgi:hypothetical protein